MTRENTTKGRPRGGLADKRQAMLTGALAVFSRDGYARASIGAIASESEVSTRTIYNHFQDKAELFQAVIQESATRVAEGQIDLIDRHLGKVTDLEADLIAYGQASVRHMHTDHRRHFALVRQINADLEHIPRPAIDAWQEAGPRRVRRALVDRLRQLGERGLLHMDDPERAAAHLAALISVSDLSYRTLNPTDEELDAIVAAGARAFLYGYARPTS
ncbi:TetR/AcrR family transcriptional regulator [Streptomyces sp. NPDC000410]|uniref:TetR/AcrR family transcriptional regulator n=1 Tax=Streptomyces sp. NPDC000410 TaxID=3154254 RepID=UPI0033316436